MNNGKRAAATLAAGPTLCDIPRPTSLFYCFIIIVTKASCTSLDHFGLSLLLRVCGNYRLEHDIRFNSKKSAVIIFRNSFVKDFTFPSFVMNADSIMEVPFVEYLGHVISADMKYDLDIMRQCRQLYAQGNALARRFHMCSDNVKVTMFRSYCSSLYTSQ